MSDFDDLADHMNAMFSGRQHRVKPGDEINGYKIEKIFGGSGMGTVCLAYSSRLKRQVVLKFLAPWLLNNKEAHERFATEALAAAQISHPNICRIYDIKEHNDSPFIVMAYEPGISLRHVLSQASINVQTALDYALQICKGLAKAHEKGIIHRDIKAENIIVVKSDSNVDEDRVVIIDFGIAKLPASNTTSPGDILGSVYTMSPEQASGLSVDHRTDIWSLGVVLFEMLTGELPFQGDDGDQIRIRIKERHPLRPSLLNSKVPKEVDKVVAKCLAKDPANRFSNAEQLFDALKAVKNGDKASGRPPKRPRKFAWKPKRKPPPLLRPFIWASGLFLMGIFFFLMMSPLPVVAVLPFDITGEPSNSEEYFEGVHYSVTNTLVSLPPFRGKYAVIPASEFKNPIKRWSPEEAYNEFNVNRVIEVRLTYGRRDVNLQVSITDPRRGVLLKSYSDNYELQSFGNTQFRVLLGIAKAMGLYVKDAAIVAWQRGISEEPEAMVVYYEALSKLRDRDKETNILEAISLLKQAITLDEEFAEAHAYLGEAYMARFQTTRDTSLIGLASEAVANSLSIDPELTQGFVTQSVIHQVHNDYLLAKEALLRALENDPLNFDAQRYLGITYHSLNEFDNAEKAFLNAIKVNTGYWRNYNALGWLYNQMGRHEDAIKAYEKVITYRPLNPEGYSNIGVQYERLGNYQEAIEWFNQAATINPDGAVIATNRALRNMAGLYYRDRNFPLAINIMKSALKQDSLSISGWLTLGNSYWHNGEPDEAFEIWQRVLELCIQKLRVSPKDHLTLSYLMETLMRMGQRGEAVSVLDELEKQNITDSEVLYRMAVTHAFLGNHSKSTAFIESSVNNGLTFPTVEFISPWLGDTLLVEENTRLRESLAPPDYVKGTLNTATAVTH